MRAKAGDGGRGVCCLGQKEELLLFVLDQRPFARRAYTTTRHCSWELTLTLAPVTVSLRAEVIRRRIS